MGNLKKVYYAAKRMFIAVVDEDYHMLDIF